MDYRYWIPVYFGILAILVMFVYMYWRIKRRLKEYNKEGDQSTLMVRRNAH